MTSFSTGFRGGARNGELDYDIKNERYLSEGGAPSQGGARGGTGKTRTEDLGARKDG